MHDKAKRPRIMIAGRADSEVINMENYCEDIAAYRNQQLAGE